MNIAYKFVDWDINPLKKLENTFPYQLKQKLLRGDKLTREEKDEAYNQMFGGAYSRTGIALHGWMFDFSQWLNVYYVEYKYGDVSKEFAFDKTSIRQSNPSQIVSITLKI